MYTYIYTGTNLIFSHVSLIRQENSLFFNYYPWFTTPQNNILFLTYSTLVLILIFDNNSGENQVSILIFCPQCHFPPSSLRIWNIQALRRGFTRRIKIRTTKGPMVNKALINKKLFHHNRPVIMIPVMNILMSTEPTLSVIQP